MANGAPANGPVTIQHRFGQTTIPAPPRRVVSAGFTEQDDLLAVGVVPIAVTTWWGDEPFEVWPWAQPKLGSAQPEVLSIYDGGFQFDRIAALQPDLIAHRGPSRQDVNTARGSRPTIPIGRYSMRPSPSPARQSTRRCGHQADNQDQQPINGTIDEPGVARPADGPPKDSDEATGRPRYPAADATRRTATSSPEKSGGRHRVLVATEPACRGESVASDAQCGSESLDGTVMPNAHAFCVVPLAIGVAIVAAPAAGADRPEPVPLFGSYDTFLDHSRQTFNGQPDFSDPSVQAASFTTTCVASGCVAHWLRLTALTENPNAPALFDYQWVNDGWESAGEYPFHCDDGSAITSTRSDSLTPNGDGSFAGERTFTVIGPGCPGDGAGTYWLPFTLTPT